VEFLPLSELHLHFFFRSFCPLPSPLHSPAAAAFRFSLFHPPPRQEISPLLPLLFSSLNRTIHSIGKNSSRGHSVNESRGKRTKKGLRRKKNEEQNNQKGASCDRTKTSGYDVFYFSFAGRFFSFSGNSFWGVLGKTALARFALLRTGGRLSKSVFSASLLRRYFVLAVLCFARPLFLPVSVLVILFPVTLFSQNDETKISRSAKTTPASNPFLFRNENHF